VPEQCNSRLSIERVEKLSIVSLKVARDSLEGARDRLRLASPLIITGADPRSLWLGPDHWLLVSNSKTADSIIGHCEETLAEVLHNAVDYSAALAVFRISGPSARQLLAAGSGIDVRPDKFPAGTCCRTFLAQIAAVIVAEDTEQFDILVDRSFGSYLNDWIADVSGVCADASLVQE
jgi:sarcosine oxidase subunit gamma